MATPVTPSTEESIADIRTRIPPPPPVALKKRQVVEGCTALGSLCLQIGVFCTAAEAALGACALAGVSFCIIVILEQAFPIKICKAYPEGVRNPDDMRRFEGQFRKCYQAYSGVVALLRAALDASLAIARALRAAGDLAGWAAVAEAAGKAFAKGLDLAGAGFTKCMADAGFPNQEPPSIPPMRPDPHPEIAD